MKTSCNWLFVLFMCLSVVSCTTKMPKLNFSKPHGIGWIEWKQSELGFNKPTPQGKDHTIITYATFEKTDYTINNLSDLKKFADEKVKDPRLKYNSFDMKEFHYSGRDCLKVEFTAEDHASPHAPPDNFFIIEGYEYLCLDTHEPTGVIYSTYSQRYLQGEQPLNGLDAEVEPFMRSIVYIRSEGKETPLIKASKNGNVSDVVKYLKQSIDIDAHGTASDWGKTALIEAAHRGYTDIVKILIEAGADINALDFYGDSALMLAIDQGHNEVVEMLLHSGADVNAQNITYGTTALMSAASKGNDEGIKMLLDSNADIDIKDWGGDTAITIATWKKTQKLQSFFKKLL